MSISENIAVYRKMAKLTQEELGAKLGVTNQAVSKWESGVSMPDIMLLPEIASVLNITLEDLYGIAEKSEKSAVSADDFPALCHRQLVRTFYDNTKMRFTHIGSSDEEQLSYQIKKMMEGCRVGCISNTEGAIVITERFAFLDLDYKSEEHTNFALTEAAHVLKHLSDRNVRKVFSFQYRSALNRSKESNTEFTLDEIIDGCGLTEEEAHDALVSLEAINLNAYYKVGQTKKYVLLYSNAVYAIAILKLAELMTEDAVWTVVRDTSMISDYAF